jgi:hypothetical protein
MDILIILTRLLWKGYCNKTKQKNDVGFADVPYKMLGN